jgi:hypothetical protein
MKKTITSINCYWQKWLLILTFALNINGLRAQVYFSEGFSSASGDTLAPTGWTINKNGNSLGWNASNPGSQSISGAGFSGNFYIVDATTQAGRFSITNASLTSPYINLVSSTVPYIKFSEQFYFKGNQKANLSFSIDSGISWTSILNYNSQSIGYPNPVTTAIACPMAGGRKAVLFRWTYTRSGSSYWWAIDSVTIGEAGAPVVITGDTSNIMASTATLAGRVTSNGNANVLRSGIVISRASNPIIGGVGVIDSFTNEITDTGTFRLNFNRLIKGTLYYYRAYAINAVDTVYDAELFFTTSVNTVIADVNNTPFKEVTKNSATVSGFIKADGGEPVFESGIIYSTSPILQVSTPGITIVITNPVVDLDTFRLTLNGLTPNGTKYYFRPYAKNLNGAAYGAIDSFTTLFIVNSFPYHESFDTITTSWLTYARGSAVNIWKCGVPSKIYLDSAHSKPNVWFTDSMGQDADCYIESPELDFSGMAGIPMLSFWHKFDLANQQDVAVVEISTDNGATYTTLSNTTGTGSNYNTNFEYGWYNFDYWSDPVYSNAFTGLSTSYSSHSNGWIRSSSLLIPAAGQASVKIRIRFFAYYSNSEGIAIDDIMITPPSLPSAFTWQNANITNVSATVNGEVTSDGSDIVLASGVVYSPNPSPSLADFVVATNPPVTFGKYKLNLSGLQPATLYYYRAYTTNNVGTAYGADSSFTTNVFATAPIVHTYKPQAAYASSVILGGNIPSNGGEPVTESGVVIATHSNPKVGINNTTAFATNPMINIDSFYVTATGLAQQTHYYVRAYAINKVDTAYGILDSFTTEKLFSTLPYTENFDSATTPWKSKSIGGNGINDWHLGSPVKTFIDSAYSAPNA